MCIRDRASRATDDGRLHTGSGLLAQSLVESLAAQGSVRAIEIVQVLPFLELGGEQPGVVEDVYKRQAPARR